MLLSEPAVSFFLSADDTAAKAAGIRNDFFRQSISFRKRRPQDRWARKAAEEIETLDVVDQKRENLLNLALSATQEERLKSENLEVGYDPADKLERSCGIREIWTVCGKCLPGGRGS